MKWKDGSGLLKVSVEMLEIINTSLADNSLLNNRSLKNSDQSNELTPDLSQA